MSKAKLEPCIKCEKTLIPFYKGMWAMGQYCEECFKDISKKMAQDLKKVLTIPRPNFIHKMNEKDKND